jgi:hypothetical protein
MALDISSVAMNSESRRRHFSTFYGGALVASDKIGEVRATLAAQKKALNFFDEVKWSKITVNYDREYIDLMNCFFDLVAASKIKIRIMCAKTSFRARRPLTREQIENQYAVLYYYFIRHAFSLT